MVTCTLLAFTTLTFNPALYNLRTVSHYTVWQSQHSITEEGALSICEPNLIDVLVSVPYLVADLLLVLLPVTSTATAEEDDGNNDEDQEYSNYGSCNDACGVGG